MLTRIVWQQQALLVVQGLRAGGPGWTKAGVTTLNSRQRHFLKALGHHLSPVVHVGHQGVTMELADETGRALNVHELIKVKFGEHAPGERHKLAEELAVQTQAMVALVIGRVALLYRARAEDPEIQLPK